LRLDVGPDARSAERARVLGRPEPLKVGLDLRPLAVEPLQIVDQGV
jgi:hypothetical protein